MSAVEQKWRKTGLLDGNDGIDSELLAHNLNEAAYLLIAEDNETKNKERMEFKAVILLPIVVRLFDVGMRVINIEMLYRDFSDWLTEKMKILPNGYTTEYEYNIADSYFEYVTSNGRMDTFIL